MNLNIFVGFFIVVIAILVGAPDIRADWTVYAKFDAFTLVFAGTIGSTLISTSFTDFKGIISVYKQLMFGGKKFLMPKEVIEILVDVSKQAQSVSRQALPDVVKNKTDNFLNRSLEMVAAGLDKEFILQTLETDIFEIAKRHTKMISTVKGMGSFAPMYGMAGTVIGVIQVLKNVTDIDNIVGGMALALLTTLYGLIFAMIIFGPSANKLKNLSDQELLTKEIIREGTEMILDKEIPLKVEKYLTAFLHSNNKDLEKK